MNVLPTFAAPARLARAVLLAVHVVSICGAAAGTLTLAIAPLAARADALSEDEQMTLAGGAWQAAKFVPCADGVVDAVHSRLDEGSAGPPTFESGVVVEIRLPNAPTFLNGQAFPTARVVHYERRSARHRLSRLRLRAQSRLSRTRFPAQLRRGMKLHAAALKRRTHN